jgi:PPOX class probable F420-dependent enzyme
MNTLQIPESHRDLIEGRFCAALTTLMPDGHPQTTPVWCNREGDCILINTMQGFRKEKNMRLNPKVTLLVYDPANPAHCVEIRGLVVDMTEDGAVQHLDTLTQLYMNRPDARFFGDSVPLELQATYRPVKVTIQPTRVRTEE